MESGQHVSRSAICPVQIDRIRIAEIVVFVVIEVHIASGI